MSDRSGSSELSVSSLRQSPCNGNLRSHPTWPKFSIGEALKSHSNAPCVEAKAREAEVCESPIVGNDRVLMSPSLLFVSDRRLKERSRRRRSKKKRRACGEEDDSLPQSEHDDDDDDDDDAAREAVEQCDHHDIGGIPPLIRAIMEEEEEGEGAAAKQQPKKSNKKHDEEINLSKRLSPGLSPQFFKRSKAGQESPLEVHSNLLYDPPPPRKDRSKRVKKQLEEEDQGKKKPPQNDGASTSAAAAAAPESEIQSCAQAMVFRGSSPGIGRCVRSSPAFSRPKKSLKRKQLQPSFAARDRWREEQVDSGAKSLHLHPKSPLLLYPRLRRSTTTTTTTTTTITGKWAESPFHQPKSMDPSSFQATSISIL
jgi:hypothetical protein